MSSESSTGSWAEILLPCSPSKQWELAENMLQNILLNLPLQTVQSGWSGCRTGKEDKLTAMYVAWPSCAWLMLTELSTKVCPRLRDLATAPAGGITQPRKNCFGQLCSIFLFPVRLPLHPLCSEHSNSI